MTVNAARKVREAHRAKGQFWTPAWVADAMVAYCIGRGASVLFDPAVGAGAFFAAARRYDALTRGRTQLAGCEIDPSALGQARASGLTPSQLRHVAVSDFLTEYHGGPYDAIVANPPYVRHHRLPAPYKARLRAFAARLLGTSLDGRAGLHIYFLLRALELLAPAGRLAFVVPADTVEGVFAPRLWRWITGRFRLDAVVTFAPAATPFPGVDTNAIIVMLSRNSPREHFTWARCARRGSALAQFVQSGFRPVAGVRAHRRRLREAITTGLSRAARESEPTAAVLGDFARVQRGIATGANNFFFLTPAAAKAARLPRSLLIPAVGRVRDVPGDVLTAAHLETLAAAGRPTLLFTPTGVALAALPRPVRAYIRRGERLGLPSRALISTRRPWYRMEAREPPPFLFAYLGRRTARFIRNEARALPLTGFLCVYPRTRKASDHDRLWRLLSHPDTRANLDRVGKSYGSGAIKVEPRALERLPLSPAALAAAGIPCGAVRLPKSRCR